jgi:hypothetical protein
MEGKMPRRTNPYSQLGKPYRKKGSNLLWIQKNRLDKPCIQVITQYQDAWYHVIIAVHKIKENG